YQELVFHTLRVVRGEQVLDRLGKTEINLLRRETALESQMYDGRVTASVVLEDVRVGDRVEYSYSIRGANPVFGGKLVDSDWSATQFGPVAQYQFRVLMPEGRTAHYRAGPAVRASTRAAGAYTELLFRRSGVPQLQGDQNTPPSAYLADQI